MITYDSIDTPWGGLSFEIGDDGLRAVDFDGPRYPPLQGPWVEAMAAYLAHRPISLDLPVDIAALPPFMRRVLEACRLIPYGAVTTYGRLAAQIGCPRAARAVGQALARNPVPVVIPCHRVVGVNGQLTGFGGGLAWKRNLLRHEGRTEY